jgi:hypothetical protein
LEQTTLLKTLGKQSLGTMDEIKINEKGNKNG